MTPKSFALVAAAIFALIALLQLLRIAMGWTIAFNGTPIPFWPSAIAVAVATLLAIVGFRAARVDPSAFVANSGPPEVNDIALRQRPGTEKALRRFLGRSG